MVCFDILGHQVGDRRARGPLLGPRSAIAGQVRVSGEALDFPAIVDAQPSAVAGRFERPEKRRTSAQKPKKELRYVTHWSESSLNPQLWEEDKVLNRVI